MNTLGRNDVVDRHHHLPVFVVGAFGGLAPTLLRIAIDLSQERKTIGQINASILLGMAIFAIMGGGLAVIWKEVDLKKVFYIGLGLPSLITIATSTATAPRMTTAGSISATTTRNSVATGKLGTLQLVSSQQYINSFGINRELLIVLPPEIGYEGATVIFKCYNELLQRTIQRGITVGMPKCADSLMVVTPNAVSERISFDPPPDTVTVMNIKAKKNTWYGLTYAVGVQSKPFDLIVSSTETSKAKQ